MEKDEKIRKKIADELAQEFRQKRKEALNALSQEYQDFLKADDIQYNNQKTESALAKDLKNYLKQGDKKPSLWFEQNCGVLFDGVILPRYREAFLYAVDCVNRWQYSVVLWRRSFRSGNYFYYCDRILGILRVFHKDLRLDVDVLDILELNLSEKESIYAYENMHIPAELYAYVLDNCGERAEKIIIDILNGEGKFYITNSLIRGICMSKNKKLHQYLGKLLLAARLQEGFRQSICEEADCGTQEAFLEILQVIVDNNLIRFSSVKRAAGTWTGLITYETSDLERISGKTISLIYDCVSDEKKRAEYLKSEDSMQIYLALWAYGFCEAEDAVAKFRELSQHGTHHQVLTAGYFASNLDNAALANDVAKTVIRDYSEPDILAVYLPYFMRDWTGKQSYRGIYYTNEQLREKYFQNEEEARILYDRLKEIYAKMPKKELVFSPCIFPWYSAKLTKAEIVTRLALIAYVLCDKERIDEICPLFSECEEYQRIALMRMTLKNPQTALQRETLVKMLSDRTQHVRKAANELVKNVELSEENYRQIEALLKYKAADMRENLIEILYQQDGSGVYETVKNLLSDKSEEKRTAGLDLVMRIQKEEKAEVLERCKPLCEAVVNPSSKEKILLDNILGTKKSEKPVLFSQEDLYKPQMPEGKFFEEAVGVFMRYFPQSEIAKELGFVKQKKTKDGTAQEADNWLEALETLIDENKDLEFKMHDGQTNTLGACQPYEFYTADREKSNIPFYDMWMAWSAEKLENSPEKIMRLVIRLCSYPTLDTFSTPAKKYAERIYGKDYGLTYYGRKYKIIDKIINLLLNQLVPISDLHMLCAAVEFWFLKCVPDEDVMLEFNKNGRKYAHLMGSAEISPLMLGAYSRKGKFPAESFALDNLAFDRCYNDERRKNADLSYFPQNFINDMRCPAGFGHLFYPPGATEFLIMAYRGVITERALYHYILMENPRGSFSVITNVAAVYREQRIATERRFWNNQRKIGAVCGLLGRNFDKESEIAQQLTEEDKNVLEFVDKIYESVIGQVLSVELTRGDTPTVYSKNVRDISRIYGMENFIAILSALGKDTLERSVWHGTQTKKASLSHLLSVCVPNPDDDVKKLKSSLKATDISEKRLIEAALYSPEWMDLVGEYLGWNGFKSGCWYFMAHMNEHFDDRKKAVIAKYTPLSAEELMAGAFDLNWFTSAYEALGEKHFSAIYDAAKYISDGTKHSRARKYADAALGRMNTKDTAAQIFEKRNQDLLRAYSLIPFKEPVEDDLVERYLNLQRFLKESRKFGNQRANSEKRAVGTAMQNLAIRAGYADVTRLTLRMETKVLEDSSEMFEDKTVEDVTVRLDVSDVGKPEIVCCKDGKILKSIPARLKKNDYILRLTDTKKKLTEQYRRTRQMFEQAMEDKTEFTVAEISALLENPVARPIIKDLVFMCQKKAGFIEKNSMTDYSGKKSRMKPDEKVHVAHPFDLYTSGCWVEFQHYLFERRIVQPFKQVFRELYIKTEEEEEMTHSLRYAGNQIQPAKTVACLKSRRWVADVEDGLQKVYYKEDIVARIYAIADWFSPADIEAPTLEWVEFSNRKTGEEIRIKDVPDIIFSEVMRDVDLAVSVAHAGGIDPETSHSTIEMRAALLEFTLPLFKLNNVEIKGTHAHIKGKFAEYTLHLGSGVVHKVGGAMIPILPVHSQHRGKIFLPFADDDPKTAEILSKAILLAEDGKIKDPKILERIKS